MARVKARREHQVPLSDRAVAVLLEARALSADALIFPAKRKGGHLSNMVFDMLLRRLEIPCVPHGFRSSFRDFLAERTSASWAVRSRVWLMSVASRQVSGTNGRITSRSVVR